MPFRFHLPGLLLLLSLLSFWGCPSAPWKLMRTVDPYLKQQPANPYAYSVRVSGARLQIKKFYTTPTIACAALQVDNRRGYGEVYVAPHKTKLVCGKLGIWALRSTTAAREPIFRRIAQDYFKITAPSQVSRWSRFYFSPTTIPVNQSKAGLICFQLRRRPDDPEAIKMTGRCRLRLTDMRVANGSVRADWMHIEPLKR